MSTPVGPLQASHEAKLPAEQPQVLFAVVVVVVEEVEVFADEAADLAGGEAVAVAAESLVSTAANKTPAVAVVVAAGSAATLAQLLEERQTRTIQKRIELAGVLLDSCSAFVRHS